MFDGVFNSVGQRFRASAAGRWYASKEPNEQKIVLGLTIVVSILLLWSLVWKPISDWEDDQVSRYDASQRSLDYLKGQETAARKMAAARPANRGRRSLLPIVSKSAETAGVKLNRFQPEDSGGVSVVLQGQRFDDVVRWIHGLEQNNQVRVYQAAIDAEAEGLVNARFTLQ